MAANLVVLNSSICDQTKIQGRDNVQCVAEKNPQEP